jgi:GNAT superfamily N-acetyltransferase
VSAPFTIRLVTPDEDLLALTAMIHAAYAPHKANGLRFWGTHQTPEDTAKRLNMGTAWLMLQDGRYIGTATLRPPNPESEVPLYRESDVRVLTQFCVCPTMKGEGVGHALHAHVEAYAREQGARWLVLDTAKPATKLIAMYEAWGYTRVGECDWRPHTNYESVLMRKAV